ncbi:MAG TPA: GNAT family N-acetyltransferase [Mycobacteriales bacterium]|nr:GNAT family N-acetyltransferase [Mycobacteriales bacterium]
MPAGVENPPGPGVLHVSLRDGTPAMLWPLSPDDGRGLRQRYEELSPDSRYDRFLSTVRTLSPGLLDRLVRDVDGVDHVALVLTAYPADGHERTVGIGRMVRYADQPSRADVAVTVEEAWRGRGVASALLAALVEHRPRGVEALDTQVSVGNRASQAMLARLGPTTVKQAGSGILDVHVDLPEPTASPTASPTA